MSERQDKKNTKAEEEAGVAKEPEVVTPPAEEEVIVVKEDSVTAAQPVIQPVAAAPGKSSSGIAWLSLLLVLLLAVGVGWLVMEALRREAVLQGKEAAALDREEAIDRRLASLEGVATREDNSLQELGDRWQQKLDEGMGEMQQGSSLLSQDIATVEAKVVDQRATLDRFGEEMDRFKANDRASWLIAEAEYLLRLANQRLIMAGDTVAAQALLTSADNILVELEDAGLHSVRAAVAADLAAIRAVPAVDVEGLYLRLAALMEQAGSLVIFKLPEQDPDSGDLVVDDWRGRLKQGYENALLKLSDYIIIRRRDVPMQSLIDPQWEGLVRQNLRMLLEQAQVALLSGNQTLYRESLERSQHWVGEFFESDEAAAQAMSREITQLADATIASSMPDLSKSLRALDEAVKQRDQQGGSE